MIFMGDTGSLALGRRARRHRGCDQARDRSGDRRRPVRARNAVRDHPGRCRSSGRESACSGWRRCTTTYEQKGWKESTVVIRFWIISVHAGADRACDPEAALEPQPNGATCDRFLPMIRATTFAGKTVAVFGLGARASLPRARCSRAAPTVAAWDDSGPGATAAAESRHPARRSRRRPTGRDFPRWCWRPACR